MGDYKLGIRSRRRLEGVHHDIVRVVERAIELTEVDFTVLEGLRTEKRQERLVAIGNSWTMKSRHLTGHAVDLAPVIGGRIPWQDLSQFVLVSEAMFKAADELGVLIQWGGDWDLDGDWRDEKRFDGPHFQIPFPYRVKDAATAQERRTMASRLAKMAAEPGPHDPELL